MNHTCDCCCDHPIEDQGKTSAPKAPPSADTNGYIALPIVTISYGVNA